MPARELNGMYALGYYRPRERTMLLAQPEWDQAALLHDAERRAGIREQ